VELLVWPEIVKCGAKNTMIEASYGPLHLVRFYHNLSLRSTKWIGKANYDILKFDDFLGLDSCKYDHSKVKVAIFQSCLSCKILL